MYLTWDGSGMHISQEIRSTECYGGLVKAMHVAAMGALGREAHSPKHGPSSRPPQPRCRKSTANFDLPETVSEWVEGSAERVRDKARQRVRVHSQVHRERARTALARTIAWAIDPASQSQTSEIKREKSPDLEGSGAHISQTISTCHN